MVQSINPDALKVEREKRKWTQAQLAEQLGCSKDTVSRWERGKSLRVRSHLRERLEAVFRVDWKTLTQAPTQEKDGPLAAVFPRTQLNTQIKMAARNALLLVCRRYQVRPAQVLELAPLLFLITAEQSLRRRAENLNHVWSLIGNAEMDCAASAPHLAPILSGLAPICQDELEMEEESITRRDIFGYDTPSGDHEESCPFTNYLRFLAGDLLNEPDLIQEISDGADYTIALDTLRESTGLSPEGERDQELCKWITHGELDVKTVTSKRQELSPEDYERWLDQALIAAKAARKERLTAIFGDLFGDQVDAGDGS